MRNVELNVIHFTENDVIVTSGILMSNIRNGVADDITFNGQVGVNFDNEYSETKFYLNQSKFKTGSSLYSLDIEEEEDEPNGLVNYNGYYKWDSTLSGYLHQ